MKRYYLAKLKITVKPDGTRWIEPDVILVRQARIHVSTFLDECVIETDEELPPEERRKVRELSEREFQEWRRRKVRR